MVVLNGFDTMFTFITSRNVLVDACFCLSGCEIATASAARCLFSVVFVCCLFSVPVDAACSSGQADISHVFP